MLEKTIIFLYSRLAHDDFLAAVASQTFVNYRPVHQCLNELLSVCLHFAKFALEGPGSSDLSEMSDEDGVGGRRLAQLCLSFSRQSGLLFQLLGQLRNQQAGCHLAQLLLRIDFNRFFSRHGHDVGTIA